MSERVFDRETLLDLTVNVIPLGIILFFVVVYLVITPWKPDFFITVISMGLLVVPFVALAPLTYFSGRAIAEAEQAEASAAALDDSTDESPAIESGETTDEETDSPESEETTAIDDGPDESGADESETGGSEPDGPSNGADSAEATDESDGSERSDDG